MSFKIINLLKQLKPRFVLYKGWVIDFSDIFWMSLLLAAFLPILPSEKTPTGFSVMGFEGSVENQYSLLTDAHNLDVVPADEGLGKLMKVIETDNLVNLEKTERSLESKGLSKQAASCLSRLFLTTHILLHERVVQQQIQSLAPSAVPAIWLLRLPAVGILTAISKLNVLELKATPSRCKRAGFIPVMVPFK